MERATTSYCHAMRRDVTSPIRDGMALMAQSAAPDLLGCPFYLFTVFLMPFLHELFPRMWFFSADISPSGSDLRFRMPVSQTKSHFNMKEANSLDPYTSSYTTLGFCVDKSVC